MENIFGKVVVRNRTINAIMDKALECGGIEIWAEKVTHGDDKKHCPAKMFFSDSISEGYSMKIEAWGDSVEYRILNKAKIIEGAKKAFKNHREWFFKNKFGFYEFDETQFDNVVCDYIVQYALFGNVYYG